MQQVSIVGLGKAGLPLAAVIAESGLKVVGVDINKELVDKINSGENPIPEEVGLKGLIDKHVPNNFSATTFFDDAQKSSVYVVIVPLVIDDKHIPDFSMLESAFKSLSKIIKKGDLVILETTVPPKTTEIKVKKWMESNSSLKVGKEVYLAFSPERIMTGVSISRYKEFPKVVGGINDISGHKAYEFYSRFCSKVDKVKNARTAELVKLSEGTYRDVNIALANELYKISDELDIDFQELRKNANHKFCNIHEAGIGVGGHCIPVYPWFLINEFKDKTSLIRESRVVNDAMVKFWVDKIANRKPERVLLVGLSYRTGVKENAYARSLAMISELKKRGFEVYGLDPLYSSEETKKIFGITKSDLFGEMDVIMICNNLSDYELRLKRYSYKVVGLKK